MFCFTALFCSQRGVRLLPVEVSSRSDSKFQNGLGFGCRLTIASSAVMSCITAGFQPDRLIPGQPEQVESCRAQRGHRADAITPVAVSILIELGIADPVPALDAPAVPHQLQQGFWGGAQAAQKQVWPSTTYRRECRWPPPPRSSQCQSRPGR